MSDQPRGLNQLATERARFAWIAADASEDALDGMSFPDPMFVNGRVSLLRPFKQSVDQMRASIAAWDAMEQRR